MTVEERELVFFAVAILALVVGVMVIFAGPSDVFAAKGIQPNASPGSYPPHYPGPYPSAQAPANFPWNHMPTLPAQSSKSRVPPFFPTPNP